MVEATRKPPLRERKFARTKLGLMEAALQRLQDRPLADVGVKELCEAADVSEATFFNYFAKKTDILTYYMQLWSLELAWHLQHGAGAPQGLAAVDALFRRAAERIQGRPGVMSEIIAYAARQRSREQPPQVGRAERLQAFPGLEGIADLEPRGMDVLLGQFVQQAIDRGELPGNTHLRSVMLSLITIFHGVPLVLAHASPQSIGSSYQLQLNQLWAGVRALAGGQA